MANVLEIRNLKVSFNGGQALKGVDLNIEENSFTSLVGISGSGKSLTALSIRNLIRDARQEGQIILTPTSAKVAYVFQDPASSLNPVFRIGEQLLEVCNRNQKMAFQALEKAALKDIPRIFRSYAHELSGGMKQRVMIAMALLQDPRLLVADEPTAALDSKTAAEIMTLLAALQKKNKLTIFFITHEMRLAEDFSDQIFVMEKGRVIERMDKSPDGQWRPKETYTQKLFRTDLSSVSPKSLIEV